jgi:hypothetical protein
LLGNRDYRSTSRPLSTARCARRALFRERIRSSPQLGHCAPTVQEQPLFRCASAESIQCDNFDGVAP